MQTPILGFAAYSGTGKTTLLEKLIPLLRARGLRVAVLKHAHHNFDIDKPGKDSYRLRKAGAEQMLIASDQRWAMMIETEKPQSFENLLTQFNHDELDLIIVEGFKGESIPKIELHRASLGHDLICCSPDQVYTDNTCGYAGLHEKAEQSQPLRGGFIAVAADTQLQLPQAMILLDINQPQQIATYIEEEFLRYE